MRLIRAHLVSWSLAVGSIQPSAYHGWHTGRPANYAPFWNPTRFPPGQRGRRPSRPFAPRTPATGRRQTVQPARCQNGSGRSWPCWPGGRPTPRSPGGCTCRSTRSDRTWTASGTRPAPAAAQNWSRYAAGRHRIGCPFCLSAGPARPGVTGLRAAKGAVRPTPGALNGAARPLPSSSGRAHAGSTVPLPRRPVPPRRKATAMKIKFTRALTITKAATATILFTMLRGVTDVNLPSCSDPGAVLNSGGCLVHQSYLHIACGWLALASLITGVVLFILKQRKASSQDQQAPPRPARSDVPRPGQAPGPAETTGPEERTHGDGTGAGHRLGLPSGSHGPEGASNFCTQCGTRAVAGDNFCQQRGTPVKTEPQAIRGTASPPAGINPGSMSTGACWPNSPAPGRQAVLRRDERLCGCW